MEFPSLSSWEVEAHSHPGSAEDLFFQAKCTKTQNKVLLAFSRRYFAYHYAILEIIFVFSLGVTGNRVQ